MLQLLFLQPLLAPKSVNRGPGSVEELIKLHKKSTRSLNEKPSVCGF